MLSERPREDALLEEAPVSTCIDQRFLVCCCFGTNYVMGSSVCHINELPFL